MTDAFRYCTTVTRGGQKLTRGGQKLTFLRFGKREVDVSILMAYSKVLQELVLLHSSKQQVNQFVFLMISSLCQFLFLQ